MNKRYLHHVWTKVRPFKTWYFFVAFVLCAGLAVVSLRQNYIRMTELRSAVYAADKSGGDVEKSLQELRAYVGAHMNTDLETSSGVYPPIQLKHTYERLLQAEKDRVNKTNAAVYTEAQEHCERQHPESFSGGPRVPCIAQYVKDHGASARSIPDAQYKFSFVSPRWSPDLAGWGLVAAGLLGMLTIVRFVLGRWLRRVTR
jgi:hypothetical protein